MKIVQNVYVDGCWQHPLTPMDHAQLVLLLGDREKVSELEFRQEIKTNYPNAEIIGCTTSGEILDKEIYDNSICLTAVEFASSQVAVAMTSVDGHVMGQTVQQLLGQIPMDNLRYVLVLADGQKINGTELVAELVQALPKDVLVTGGLAGDGERFQETIVWHNDVVAKEQILICGFYGENLGVAHGSKGGWDPFGPERLITRSEGNVLKTLDNKPALELYKKYLGEYAEQLPSSALLFPLSIKRKNQDQAITRTILNINEQDGSMIFAGDVPEGAKAQLMRANFERLIDGAETAAEHALEMVAKQADTGLIIMVSCVGRRLVLKQRAEEEVEAVYDLFGDRWQGTGFYSYGEISPILDGNDCELHNQTMTITAIFERNA